MFGTTSILLVVLVLLTQSIHINSYVGVNGRSMSTGLYRAHRPIHHGPIHHNHLRITCLPQISFPRTRSPSCLYSSLSTLLEAEAGEKALARKRILSLGALVIQNTALILLMRMSRVNARSSAMYIASTAVVMCEVIKTVVSVIGYYTDDCRCNLEMFIKRCQSPNIAWHEIFSISVPAFLYVIQNNLQYYAVSNLPAEVYQVLIQGKIITTALFSAILLKKRYSIIQWSSVVALSIGVGLVQLSLTGAATALFSTSATQMVSRSFQFSTASKHINFALGIPSVLVSVMTSGFAAVYLEKMLKQKDGFWARNIQLSIVSLMISLFGALVKDAETIVNQGFFFGYNPLVLSVILTQALGGMLVAFVVRYSNSVMKGFATSGSIILSCALSSLLLKEHKLNAMFTIGAGVVSAAAIAWSVSPPPLPPSSSVLHHQNIVQTHDFSIVKDDVAILGNDSNTVKSENLVQPDVAVANKPS